EKQERTVLLKYMYQYDVILLKGVTRATPFQFLRQAAAKRDHSHFADLFLPLFFFAEIKINFGVHSFLCHNNLFCMLFIPLTSHGSLLLRSRSLLRYDTEKRYRIGG